jgi:plastocyanin
LRKLIIAAVVCGAAATPAVAATKTVKVGDDWFVKPGNGSATVSKGTTVKWTNVGKSPHTVKVKKGPQKFESNIIAKGKSYSKKVKKKGTYTIICTIHSGQKMTLRVK